MTEINVAPMDVNCPVCPARAGQSCQEQDGRQVAAIAALATGEHVPSRVIPPAVTPTTNADRPEGDDSSAREGITAR